MKQNAIRKTILLLAGIIGGFVVVFLLSDFIEKNRPALPESYGDEDLSLQGARLKGYSLGAEGLIADWYWMRSLQYLGNKIVKNPDARISLDNLNSLNPRLLYPYLDNATTLDPRFISVYEFGATVLPAIDKEQAIKLLKKGIEENPNEWLLYQNLGYIYWRLGDYERASEIYAQGARVPNAPKFMQMMVAKTKTDGGSRETARAIYEQMVAEAQDEQTKENAALRLLQLDSLDERDVIQKVLDAFGLKKSRCASSWRELYPYFGSLTNSEGIRLKFDEKNSPIDPKGFAYSLDTKNCKPQLADDSIIPTN